MPLKLYRRPGSKVWHYRGTVGAPGNRQRLRGSTGTEDKNTAAREASTIEQRYWNGHHNGAGAILTFEQACTKFLADGKPGRFLQPVRDHFKDTPVKDITTDRIKAMAIELYGHCTNASKNRLAITPAQSVINHCAEAGLCNPIRVPRYKAVHKEKEPATLQWVHDFRATAKPHLGAYALFMFLTGARPSEALAIERDRDLDLQNAVATLRQTKVEHDKLVQVLRKPHLPPILVAALANLEEQPNRPLFIYRRYGHMIETWRSMVEKAKIKRLTPHCCRHGFATELLRRGVDVHTVAWLGGWASAKQVLETYGHAIKRRDITNMLTDLTGTPLTQALDEVAVSASKALAI
jgi:integrase